MLKFFKSLGKCLLYGILFPFFLVGLFLLLPYALYKWVKGLYLQLTKKPLEFKTAYDPLSSAPQIRNFDPSEMMKNVPWAQSINLNNNTTINNTTVNNTTYNDSHNQSTVNNYYFMNNKPEETKDEQVENEPTTLNVSFDSTKIADKENKSLERQPNPALPQEKVNLLSVKQEEKDHE